MIKAEFRMETCREIWMMWEKKDGARSALNVMKEYENCIRADALRDSADRAAKEIKDQGMEEVVSIRRLRAAILAGEVKE